MARRDHDQTTSISCADCGFLKTLARAVLPYLRDELAELDDGERRWMTANDTPCPRATKRACRRGEIEGARKLHRRWIFTAKAWATYVERFGEPAVRRAPQIPENESPEKEEAAALAAFREEFGFTRAAGDDQ